MEVTPIILAAGRSTRMGRNKALLELGGEATIVRALRACREGGAGPAVVVLGHQKEEVADVLPAGIVTCFNEAFGESGPAASLQCGLREMRPDADAFLLYPVDFALVTGDDVAAILAAWPTAREQGRLGVVPSHEMHRGHPALFSRKLEAEFLALSTDAPLHTVLRAHAAEIEHVMTENEGVLMNMDTPEDYEHCKQALARETAR